MLMNSDYLEAMNNLKNQSGGYTKMSDQELVDQLIEKSVSKPNHDPIEWRVKTTLAKFDGDYTAEQILAQNIQPNEITESEDNLLMYGGASVLWELLKGNGTTTAGQALTYFNNANAAIGIGDSATAEAATQTDLQAATNKLRKGMDATYPLHTDGVVVAAATMEFKATYGVAEANYAWNEWAIFNSATAATGRMLNRKVVNQGTKNGGTWQFTVQISLA